MDSEAGDLADLVASLAARLWDWLGSGVETIGPLASFGILLVSLIVHRHNRRSEKIRAIDVNLDVLQRLNEKALDSDANLRAAVLSVRRDDYVNHSALRTALPQAQRNQVGTLCMFAVRGPLGDPERAGAIVDQLIDRGEIDPAEVDRDAPLGFLTAPAGSLAEAAYRFCRHAPGIDVTITGTGSPDHLRQNIEAITGPPLPDEVLDRIARIFGRVTSESGEPPKKDRGTDLRSTGGSQAP